MNADDFTWYVPFKTELGIYGYPIRLLYILNKSTTILKELKARFCDLYCYRWLIAYDRYCVHKYTWRSTSIVFYKLWFGRVIKERFVPGHVLATVWEKLT